MNRMTFETASVPPPVLMTAVEHARLSALADALDDSSAGASLLERELARATIVPPAELPPDVVTMGATVEYIDVETARPRTVTLVYPWRADIAQGLVSVTAPVGGALIGLRVGDRMELTTPAATTRQLRIERLISRPAPAP